MQDKRLEKGDEKKGSQLMEKALRERIKHLECHLTMITRTDPTSPQSMIMKKHAEDALWKNRLKEQGK